MDIEQVGRATQKRQNINTKYPPFKQEIDPM